MPELVALAFCASCLVVLFVASVAVALVLVGRGEDE